MLTTPHFITNTPKNIWWFHFAGAGREMRTVSVVKLTMTWCNFVKYRYIGYDEHVIYQIFPRNE